MLPTVKGRINRSVGPIDHLRKRTFDAISATSTDQNLLKHIVYQYIHSIHTYIFESNYE